MPEVEVKTRNYSVVLLNLRKRCGVQDETQNKTRNTVLIEGRKRETTQGLGDNKSVQRRKNKLTRQSQQQRRMERKKGKKDKLKVDTKKEKENRNIKIPHS
jgi:hypothetical protein